MIDDGEKYIVSFKDCKGIKQEQVVSEDIFKLMDKFELEDLSFLNEYDNHIEHSQIYENNLNNRALNKEVLLEDLVEEKFLKLNILDEIEKLPAIQKRRLKKYFFEEKTFEQIAVEENCTKRAIKFSVDIAIQKISKKF